MEALYTGKVQDARFHRASEDSTSNTAVMQPLSVSTRILSLLAAAARRKTYIDVWWSGMRRWLCVSPKRHLLRVIN